METLEKKSSNILSKKFLFSIKRASILALFLTLSYFSSFSSISFGNLLFSFLLIIFFIFNFYLFGDLVEYVFKIHYRVGSSINRLISRVLLGYFLILLLRKVLPLDIFINFFYFFIFLNFVYFSYPTRSRLYDVTVRSHFSEFKFLDKSERIVLFLIIFYFIFSIPFVGEGLSPGKDQGVLGILLSSIKSNLNSSLALISYKYLFYGSMLLACLYSTFRVFFSRRVSLLGVFLLQSNWSFYKLYEGDLNILTYACLVTVLLWLYFFCLKSLTYRSGLLFGLFLPASLVLEKNFFYSFLILTLSLTISFQKKGKWFILQFFRYSLLGVVSSALFFYKNISFKFFQYFSSAEILASGLQVFRNKAFFINSMNSIALIFALSIFKKSYFRMWCEVRGFNKLAFILLPAYWFIFAFFKFSQLNNLLSIEVILLTFLSLPVVDFIIWRLNNYRDKRTAAFFLFIVFILLDSHLEGRVKVFLSSFF